MVVLRWHGRRGTRCVLSAGLAALLATALCAQAGSDGKDAEKALKETNDNIEHAAKASGDGQKSYEKCRAVVEDVKKRSDALMQFKERFRKLLDEIDSVNGNQNLTQEQREDNIDRLDTRYKALTDEYNNAMDRDADSLAEDFSSEEKRFRDLWEEFVKLADAAWAATRYRGSASKHHQEALDAYVKYFGLEGAVDHEISKRQGRLGTALNVLTKSYEDLSRYVEPELRNRSLAFGRNKNDVDDLKNRCRKALDSGPPPPRTVRYLDPDGADVMPRKDFPKKSMLGYPEPESRTRDKVYRGELVGLGKEFLHWSLEPGGPKYDLQNNPREIEENMALYMVLRELPVIISFHYDDGTPYGEEEKVLRSQNPVLLEPAVKPEKWGYECVGWKRDGDEGDKPFPGFNRAVDSVLPAATTPNDKLTLSFKPAWKEVKFIVTYLDDEGGDERVVTRRELTLSQKMPEVDVPPRPGYEPSGWQTDDRRIVKAGTPFSELISEPASALSLRAVRKPILRTVKFLSRTAESAKPVEQENLKKTGTIEKPVARPDDPILAGYDFEGWYAEGEDEPFDFEEPLLDNVTLVARWKPTEREVTLHDAGRAETQYDGPNGAWTIETNLAQPPDPKARDNYDFVGWTAKAGNHLLEANVPDEAMPGLFAFGAPVDDNIDLYAVWRRRSVLVTFNSSTLKEPLTVRMAEGETVAAHLPEIQPPQGCHIKRWRRFDAETGLYSADSYNLEAPVTGDLTLKPEFERSNPKPSSSNAKPAPKPVPTKKGPPKLGAKPAALHARPALLGENDGQKVEAEGQKPETLKTEAAGQKSEVEGPDATDKQEDVNTK